MNPPNIFLIVLDTARARNFSMYGYNRNTTPNLQKLAEDGTVYHHAISPSPWSLPSHASMLTGELPSNHETYAENQHLEPDGPLLTRQLKKQGYTTCGISSNSWVSPEFGFGAGFDSFTSTWKLFNTDIGSRTISEGNMRERISTYVNNNLLKSVLNVLYRRMYFKQYDYGALRVNYEAKRILESTDQPFFLFLNYMEPHLEYGPPKFAEEFVSGQTDINQDPWSYIFGVEERSEDYFNILQGLYDSELKYVDWRVGKLINKLKQNDQYEDSLIVVTSDHGENIGEHQLMDHQYCLYNTLLHVPLIVKYPSQIKTANRVRSPVSTIDIFPTICSMLNMDVRNTFDGEVLPRKSDNPGRYVVSEYLSPMPSVDDIVKQYPQLKTTSIDWINRTIRSVQDTKSKYIEYDDGRQQYFDLENDPQEEQDIMNELSMEMLEKLQTIIETKTTDDYGSKSRELSSETQQMLNNLGYLN